MNPILKVLLRPVASAFVSYLGELRNCITSGNQSRALEIVDQMQRSVEAAKKYLE